MDIWRSAFQMSVAVCRLLGLIARVIRSQYKVALL